MDNPYEAPSTRPLRSESRRDLWHCQLTCPHCGQPGVSAGVAYLAHPFLKVRCRSCRGRSRVKLFGVSKDRIANPFMALQTLHRDIDPCRGCAIHVETIRLCLQFFNSFKELLTVTAIHHVVRDTPFFFVAHLHQSARTI